MLRYSDIWNRDEEHFSSCNRCGFPKSSCNCNFQSSPQQLELNSECVLVNSVVCSKEVQKVAEAIIPLEELGLTIGGGEPLPLITLTPDLGAIVQNKVVIKDKVINIGYIPATITVAGIATPIEVSLPFQAETPCPGACPGDTLTETPLEVEAIIIQPIPLATVGDVVGVPAAIFKVILRTTITVTRPLVAKLKKGSIECLEEVNTHRCEPAVPPTIRFPLTNGGNGGNGTPAPGV